MRSVLPARRPAVSCLGALLVAVLLHASPGFAQSRALFSDDGISRTQSAIVDPMVIRSRQMRADLTLLTAPGGAGGGLGAVPTAARSIDLNLFADVNLIAQLDRIETVGDLGFAWVGSISGEEATQVILAVADGVLTGTIIQPAHLYSIRTAGNGLYHIIEVDRRAIPPDPEPLPPPEGNRHPDIGANDTAADTGDVFDLLLYYTSAVRSAAGGTAAMNSFITASIAQVNSVYANSGITSRLRLVAAIETGYVDSGSLSVDLPTLRSSSDAQTTRNRYGADLVTMIVNRDPSYSGLAYVMTGVNPSFESSAYSVEVYYSYISYVYALAHELGHNMGCLHEPGNNSNNGAFSYSQGYTDTTNRFYTVMSYGLGCSSCTQITQFSSPVNTYRGYPVGTSTQDNQRTIMNTRSTVANFRQAVSTGTLTAPTGFAASASGSTVTLTWGRPTTGTPTSYVIEAGSAPGLANLANFSTGSTATSYIAGGVGNGTYYVRAKATDGVQTSPASNEATLVVGSCSTAPPPPSGLAASVSGSTVTLTWSPAATATTYIIEAGSASGLTNIANSDLGSPATSFVATGVGPGTYYVRLRARNPCGTSGTSNEIALVVR